MKFTSEERREVARKLREKGPVVDNDFDGDWEAAVVIIDKIIGTYGCATWETFYNRLADLIEPNGETWLNGYDVGFASADDWYEQHTDEELAEHGLKRERTCHMVDTDHEYEDSIRCDVCQMTFNRPWEPFKFCPNCGARVVSGDGD